MSPTAEGSQSVHEWLVGLRLEQYSLAFQDLGLESVQECRELTVCELEHMGVALPGHRKRILGSLQKLFPSERGIGGEEEEEGQKPIPRERTKFRNPARANSKESCSRTVEPQEQKQKLPTNNLVAHKKGLPPIPPRATQNCPPVPFSTVSVTAATNTGEVTPINLAPVSDLHTVTKATHLGPVPTLLPVPVRPLPRILPLAQMQQTGDCKPSPVSPSPVSVSPVSSSHVSSSSSSSSSLSSLEQFHLYEQCSSPGHSELGVPPLPPKSYAVVTPREPKVTPPTRPPRRPPIPPRITPATSSKTTPFPRSPTALR